MVIYKRLTEEESIKMLNFCITKVDPRSKKIEEIIEKFGPNFSNILQRIFFKAYERYDVNDIMSRLNEYIVDQRNNSETHDYLEKLINVYMLGPTDNFFLTFKN